MKSIIPPELIMLIESIDPKEMVGIMNDLSKWFLAILKSTNNVLRFVAGKYVSRSITNG